MKSKSDSFDSYRGARDAVILRISESLGEDVLGFSDSVLKELLGKAGVTLPPNFQGLNYGQKADYLKGTLEAIAVKSDRLPSGRYLPLGASNFLKERERDAQRLEKNGITYL